MARTALQQLASGVKSHESAKEHVNSENLIRMMVNLKTIDSTKAKELAILSEDEFAQRMGRI